MTALLVMSRCLRSLFVMSVACLFVLVVLLVSFGLFVMFDGSCCYVLLVVMYAWCLPWSCLGVCDRCSFCPLLICLCVLFCLYCLFCLLCLMGFVVICFVI